MSLVTDMSVPDNQVKEDLFYVLMESHVPYFRTHAETRYVEVSRQEAEKYKGDLHGLLDTLSVNKKYHYLVMRVNDYTSSQEYDGKRIGFYIPNPRAVAEVVSTYSSKED